MARPLLPQPVGPSQTMFCCLGHVVEAVVQRHDPLAVQLRLAGEGERLDLQHLGDVGPFAPQQPGVLALDAVFRLQHVFQQPLVRETPAAGLGQQLVPMGQQSSQTEILEDLPQFFIHRGPRFPVRRLGSIFPRRFVIDGQVRLVGQKALLVGRTLAKALVHVHVGQVLLVPGSCRTRRCGAAFPSAPRDSAGPARGPRRTRAGVTWRLKANSSRRKRCRWRPGVWRA